MESKMLSLLLVAVYAVATQSTTVFSQQCLHVSTALSWNSACGTIGGDEILSLIQPSVISGNHFTRKKSNTTKAKPQRLTNYGPWSYKPVCTKTFGDRGHFCVYTSLTFGEGRGISLFTTPSLAKLVSRLPAFKNGHLDGANNSTSPPWKAQQLPGRGIGLVATRDIHFGETVTSFTPALLVHVDLNELLSPTELERYQRIAINQLPSATRRMFLGLARRSNAVDQSIQDIIDTNSFRAPIDMGTGEQGMQHAAVYPETSRINHDCRPK